MPYIKPENRNQFAVFKDALLEVRIVDAGELNYLITQLLQAYLHQNGWRYNHMNDVLGAIEAAKLELYRRKIASYEDRKVEENGDVY